MTASRKRLTFYLALGLVVGLFLTACAGVAVGKVDLPGGISILQPVDMLHGLSLGVQPAEPMMMRAVEAQKAMESQLEYWHGIGGCSR